MRRMDVRGGSLAERTPLSLGSRLRRVLACGQTMVEYALLLSLVALALVGTIGGMAGQVGGRFNAISNTLAAGGNGGLGGGGTTPGGGSGGGTVTPPPTTGTGNNNGGNTGTGNNNGGQGGNNGGGSNGTNPDGTIGNTGMTKPEIDKIIDEGADKGLDGISWRQLSKLSPYAATHKDEFYDWIGRSKQVKINNETVSMRLVGIGQDNLSDGSGKAGFSFLSDGYKGIQISDSDWSHEAASNDHGWDNSSYRTKLINLLSGGITATDSSNMKIYIKEVTKISSHYKGGSGISHNQTSSDKLWAPSVSELFGKLPDQLKALDNQGEQYDFFRDNGVKFVSADKVTGNSYYTNYKYENTNWLSGICVSGQAYTRSLGSIEYMNSNGDMTIFIARYGSNAPQLYDNLASDKFIPVGFCI